MAESHSITDQETQAALGAALAVGAGFAGVDLLYGRDGTCYVIEIQRRSRMAGISKSDGNRRTGRGDRKPGIARSVKQTMDVNALTASLSRHMPSVLRWSGALARQLRKHNIAVAGKHSGSAATDALTLADLSVQELIVAALRDVDPQFRRCRIEAEETTGDLARFAKESDFVLAIDPIDGTKQYRDRTGNGYSVMLHLRDRETVRYSLVYIPESGANGTWVEVRDGAVFCGPDDPSQPAADVLRLDSAWIRNLFRIPTGSMSSAFNRTMPIGAAIWRLPVWRPVPATRLAAASTKCDCADSWAVR